MGGILIFHQTMANQAPVLSKYFSHDGETFMRCSATPNSSDKLICLSDMNNVEMLGDSVGKIDFLDLQD